MLLIQLDVVVSTLQCSRALLNVLCEVLSNELVIPIKANANVSLALKDFLHKSGFCEPVRYLGVL